MIDGGLQSAPAITHCCVGNHFYIYTWTVIWPTVGCMKDWHCKAYLWSCHWQVCSETPSTSITWPTVTTIKDTWKTLTQRITHLARITHLINSTQFKYLYIKDWQLHYILWNMHHFSVTDYIITNVMKKHSERRKHCALAVVRWSKNFSSRCRPPFWGHGTAKI